MTYESIYILIDFCINFNNTFFITWRNFPFPRKYPCTTAKSSVGEKVGERVERKRRAR